MRERTATATAHGGAVSDRASPGASRQESGAAEGSPAFVDIVVRQNVKFSEYADGFFDWEGTYVKRARTRQRKTSRKLGLTNMGHTHADEMNAFLKNHLISYIGDKRLSTFTSEEIEQWIDFMLETPRRELLSYKDSMDERALSPRSINHMLICLRNVFGQAKREGVVSVQTRAATASCAL